MVFLIVSGLVAFLQISQIERNVVQLADVQEPLGEALLEMEINVAETARAVLDYTLDRDAEGKARAHRSAAEFQRFAAEYLRLAQTEEERRLGEEVVGHYTKFWQMGTTVIAVADRLAVTVDRLKNLTLRIDDAIGERLGKNIDPTAPKAMFRRNAALEMEISVAEASAAATVYVSAPELELVSKFHDSEADFGRAIAAYRSTLPSAEEERLLEGVEEDFAALVEIGTDTIAIVERMLVVNRLLEVHVDRIDEVFDKRMQPLIRRETLRAKAEAKISATSATITLVVLSCLALVVAIAGRIYLARSISVPLGQLATAAAKIGKGDLDAPINVNSADEIGDLATVFRQMAGDLATTMAVLTEAEAEARRLNETLEERVTQRTAKLRQEVVWRVRAEEELRAAKEEAELANRAKSEFLANMSHELRTPLNAVIGFSEMIRGEMFGAIGNAKYVEYATDIADSGKHLLDLITDILDLSKIEAGKLELCEDEVDVARVIDACLTLVKERAGSGGLTLKCEIPPELPALRADERKLKQILLNLLSNAVKFTPEGGTVTLAVAVESSDAIVIQVIDTGIGIAPEDIATVMSPFGQVDSALSREFDGTGLGLPLTKALVELHGATFELESEVGVGTTATVRFPLGRLDSHAASAA